MARRRRSHKTTPLKELVFVLLLASALVVVMQFSQIFNATMANLWVVALFVLAVGIALYIFFMYKLQARQKALRAIELSHVDAMTGVEFEKYVAALLNSRGYKTTMTPPSSDYGVDIIATKDGVKTAVQIKRYSSKLDQKPVREAMAGKSVRKYGCTEAMVVTNSTFTEAAKFLASEGGCRLVDREVLGEWVVEFQNTSHH